MVDSVFGALVGPEGLWYESWLRTSCQQRGRRRETLKMVVRFQMQENVFLLLRSNEWVSFISLLPHFRYHCYIILAPDSKVHKHQIYSLLTESCFQRYTVFVFWHAGGMLLKTYTFLSTGVKPVKQSGSFGQKDNNKLSIFNLKCHHNVGKRLQDRFISLSTS